MNNSFNPDNCFLCGNPVEGHDAVECELVLMAWKPIGLINSPESQDDNKDITER